MQDEQDRLRTLEEQVMALQKRVEVLEALQPPPLRKGAFPGRNQQFMRRLSAEEDRDTLQEVQGTISYMGRVQFGPRRHRLQRQQVLPQIFQDTPEPLAQVFAALASPHRIIILRALCKVPHSRQQLQNLLGMASAGQLYHHLKELQAVGLIIQPGRSSYTIAPGAVIPICVALMVASQLAFSERREDEHQEVFEQEQTEAEE